MEGKTASSDEDPSLRIDRPTSLAVSCHFALRADPQTPCFLIECAADVLCHDISVLQI